MDGNHKTCVRRAVMVQTIRGPIEGRLEVGARVRTSDYLNHNCSRFLPIHIEDPPTAASCFAQGQLSINSSSIMFLAERGIGQNLTDARVEAGRFARTGVRLAVGSFEIEGFAHLPPLSDLMSWITKNRLPFMSITAASICGIDQQFAASYLAFNPQHVQLVQQFDPAEELAELAAVAGCANG